MWPKQRKAVLLKYFREETEIAFDLHFLHHDPHKRMPDAQPYTPWPEGNEKQIFLARVWAMNLLPHKDSLLQIYREGQLYWYWCRTLSFFQACWKNSHRHTSHRLSAEKNFWTLFFLQGLRNQDIELKGHQPFAAAPQKLFHMQDIHIHKRALLTPSYLYIFL